MIECIALHECCEFLVKQTVGSFNGNCFSAPLEQPDGHRAGHFFVDRIDVHVEIVHERFIPLRTVAQVSPLLIDESFEFVFLTGAHIFFKRLMCTHDDACSRSFVNAANFQTDNTVFNVVRDSDAVSRTHLVQLGDQGNKSHVLTVELHRQTFQKTDFDCECLVRSVFDGLAYLKNIFQRRNECRILNFAAFS